MYKDFPIVSNHPQAADAAEAAQCAGEQDAYWEMHERLFAQPEEWDTTQDAARASFERYADELDLDADALRSCLDDERYAADVQANFEEAAGLGLTGTPSFIINGKLLVGAHPTETWIEILDQELAEQ